MIRFIDLKGQISSEISNDTNFAFYDTVVDRFLSFARQQVFDSIPELKTEFDIEYSDATFEQCRQDWERLKSLIPKNFFNEGT